MNEWIEMVEFNFEIFEMQTTKIKNVNDVVQGGAAGICTTRYFK